MTDQQDKSVIIERFSDILKGKGKRKTPERIKILEKVLDFKKLFTVEQLYQVMLNDDFPVSRSTLYNTVDVLMEIGWLRKMNTGESSIAYERVEQTAQIHLKCEHCGKIKLVKDTSFMAYMNARKFMAFTTSYYNLTVYGVCNDCARRIKQLKRKQKSDKK
ncbi:MAG: transcriptional repressor [Muribaculaceae bacterium]|nr:transcriptional repressor [Muribaculaceae bacterium]